MTDLVASTPPQAPQQLSKEEGFITFDIFGAQYSHKIPRKTAGLLAFLFVEDDSDSELVLRVLLLDDLAKGFLESRPYCGRANRVAYRAFPTPPDGFDARVSAMAERLKLYAQLTEKYNAPQDALSQIIKTKPARRFTDDASDS
jgi:hypothetical protein